MNKRSILFSLIGVAVLSGALFYLVMESQKHQDITSEASTSVAKIYISPAEKVLPPPSTFGVFVETPVALENAQLSIQFDNNLLTLVQAPSAAEGLDIAKVTDLNEANNSGNILVEVKPTTPLTAGVHQLITLSFETKTTEVLQTTIHLDEGSMLTDINQNIIPKEVDHANISIRPQ